MSNIDDNNGICIISNTQNDSLVEACENQSIKNSESKTSKNLDKIMQNESNIHHFMKLESLKEDNHENNTTSIGMDDHKTQCNRVRNEEIPIIDTNEVIPDMNEIITDADARLANSNEVTPEGNNNECLPLKSQILFGNLFCNELENESCANSSNALMSFISQQLHFKMQTDTNRHSASAARSSSIISLSYVNNQKKALISPAHPKIDAWKFKDSATDNKLISQKSTDNNAKNQHYQLTSKDLINNLRLPSSNIPESIKEIRTQEIGKINKDKRSNLNFISENFNSKKVYSNDQSANKIPMSSRSYLGQCNNKLAYQTLTKNVIYRESYTNGKSNNKPSEIKQINHNEETKIQDAKIEKESIEGPLKTQLTTACKIDGTTYLSIYNDKRRYGLSLYNNYTKEIQCFTMEELETIGYQILTKFLCTTKFDIVVIPSRANWQFVDYLKYILKEKLKNDNNQIDSELISCNYDFHNIKDDVDIESLFKKNQNRMLRLTKNQKLTKKKKKKNDSESQSNIKPVNKLKTLTDNLKKNSIMNEDNSNGCIDWSKYFYQMKANEYDHQKLKFHLMKLDFSKCLSHNKNNSQQIGSNPQISEKDKLRYIETIIDFNDIVLTNSIAGLFHYLSSNLILDHNYDISKFHVNAKDNFVYLDKKTYDSLQIFKQVNPNNLNQIYTKKREGFSLFKIFQSYVSTQQGKQYLKNLFLTPINDIIMLEKRFDAIEYIELLLRMDQKSMIKGYLNGIHNLSHLIKRFKNYKISVNSWRKMIDSIQNINDLISTLKILTYNLYNKQLSFGHNHSHHYQIEQNPPDFIKKLCDIDQYMLIQISNHLKKYIVTESTRPNDNDKDRAKLKHGYDMNLDDLLNLRENMDKILECYGKELKRITKYSNIPRMGIIYIPNLGYYIIILKQRDYIPDIDHNGSIYLFNHDNDNDGDNTSDYRGIDLAQKDDAGKFSRKRKKNQKLQEIDHDIQNNNGSQEGILANKKLKLSTLIDPSFAMGNIKVNLPEKLKLGELYRQKTQIGLNKLKRDIYTKLDMKNKMSSKNENSPIFSSNTNPGKNLSRNSNLTDIKNHHHHLTTHSDNQFCDDDDNEDNDIQKNSNITNYEENPSIWRNQKSTEDIINIDDIVYDETWQFEFEDEDTLYFRNFITDKLQEEYGDIETKILEIERSLLQEFENYIIKEAPFFININDLVAELDSTIGLVYIAKEFNLVRPIFCKENHFSIVEGRNLISEYKAGELYVTNDYHVHNYTSAYNGKLTDMINPQASNKFIILTGPNYSGKSVYLKQVGMIVFLAHIGSFVPAKSCILGPVDKILTSIHLTETLSGNKIGFEEEVHNIYKTWKLATNRSLILLDEPGKNCSFTDSISLVLTLIQRFSEFPFPIKSNLSSHINDNNNKFINLNSQKKLYESLPTVIMTTHLKELYLSNLVKENYIVRFYMMEAIIEKQGVYYTFAPKSGLMNNVYEEYNDLSEIKTIHPLARTIVPNMNSNNSSMQYHNLSLISNLNHNEYSINLKQAANENRTKNLVKIISLAVEDAIKFNDPNENNIIYQYKVKPGFALNSFSAYCGQRIGFNREVLNRVIGLLNANQMDTKTEISEDVLEAIFKDYDDFTTILVRQKEL